jgi:hypothetical protein
MFFADMLLAILVALLLSIIYTVGFRRPASWRNFLIFFTVLFLAAWAGGVWLTPIGPALWGLYWLPFLIVGVIVALLLAAFIPNPRPRSRIDAERQADKAAETEAALSVFFWILTVVLLIVIAVRYF